MDIFSPWHLLIVLVIIVLIFGTGKLTKIGPDLGKAMRGFKSALHGGDEADKQKTADGKDKLQADPPAASSATHQEQRDSSESKHESP